MYLTQFEINSARRGARKLLASPQAMHAATRAAFALSDARFDDVGRVLWRLDYSGPRVTLYLASPTQPDLTHLVEQAGWPTTQTWRTRDYSPFLTSLVAGQQWAFRVTANPTRHGRKTEGGQTQRFGHVTVTQQEEWFVKRTQQWGFELPRSSADSQQLSVHSRAQHSFRRQDRRVTISTATFDGYLTVIDPDALRHSLTHGIGSAKAYGCGLMTLAPAT